MLGMQTTANAITTGIREIVEVLGGGIREGSLVLLEGEAKSGKSVLSQYMAYYVLRSRESAVACYTVDNDAEALIAQMDSLSLFVRQDFVTDRLRIYPMASTDTEEEADESLRVLIKHIADLPERFKLVTVDSITPFMTPVSPVSKFDFLQECKELCARDRTIILIVDSHAFEGKMLSRAYAMSDYYLRLRSKDMMLDAGQMDTRVVKILQVTKLGGAERQAQEDLSFEIKPKVGIQILPFVKVKV